MDVLAKHIKCNHCDRIFAIVDLTTNEISIVSPFDYDDFIFFGLDDWRNLTIVGESVVVTDDMGYEYRIIRIK